MGKRKLQSKKELPYDILLMYCKVCKKPGLKLYLNALTRIFRPSIKVGSHPKLERLE